VAAPKETCATICGSPTTEKQISCYEAFSCGEIATTANLNTLCPSGTPSTGAEGTATVGQPCTCAGASATSTGLCSGTGTPCAPTLSCIYESGSSGAGKCFAARCCTTTTACDNDTSLLKPCGMGSTCKRTPIGYYCGT
jgi:hypothetical protein